jgi:hypothetical protein
MPPSSQNVSSPIGAFVVLALAAYLEVQGNACFQSGLYHSSGAKQIGWFVTGTVVLVHALLREAMRGRAPARSGPGARSGARADRGNDEEDQAL